MAKVSTKLLPLMHCKKWVIFYNLG